MISFSYTYSFSHLNFTGQRTQMCFSSGCHDKQCRCAITGTGAD